MLEDLSIQDFALIDSVTLDFFPGFTILSGETGAGKSILIGALTFLLGGKADLDSIRSGASEARVSGTLLIPETAQSARDWMAEHGITLENNRVLLRRMIRSTGKSAAWIQDTPVTRNELSELTSFVFDIHGQHAHQSLLRVDEHRRFLDAYAGIVDEVSSFSKIYAELAQKKRSLEEMSASDEQRIRKIEVLTFSVEEIHSAKLREGEDAELEGEEQRLSQYEKLHALTEALSDFFHGPESIVGILKKSRSALASAAGIDASLSALETRLDTAYYEVQDIADELASYTNALAYDPSRLEFIEERLSLIFKLKQKYGETIQHIQQYARDAEMQLEQLRNWEVNKGSLEAEIAELEKEAFRKGRIISAKRAEASERMQQSVEAILRQLGMPGTAFRVAITLKDGNDRIQTSGPYGFDTVEFMISPNPGEPLRPLARIASGGELSRVMLALKTVLADADETSTLIFDEIDTGIGGEVALAVGSHLHGLSQRKQILCITHLASIAVQADNHIKIEKRTDSGKTLTNAYPVAGRSRIEEVARMLAGDGFSAASVQHAEELLQRYATVE